LIEDWFEVVNVDYSMASIPFFRVDILLSSKSIWFGAKTIRIESDNKVKLKEVLVLPHLPPGQHLGSRKVLKVFVINNNINEIDRIF